MSDVAAPAGLKEKLQRERAAIRALHEGKALGGQTASALTDLVDRVVGDAWRAAMERVPAPDRPRVIRELALVAVGGYGRGDLAPFSDIDLLFLHAKPLHPSVQAVVSGLVRDLWDVGLKLSQSVRSPADCVAFAKKDLPHRTALTEARLLLGAQSLFHELQRRLHRLDAATPISRLIDAVLEERGKEHQDYFATVNLLEPNVKKSPGGLRDLHVLRWLAQPRYGTRDPEMLRVGGVITPEDARTFGDVYEFLSRIRHELHFHAGGPQDVLLRDEQVRIALWLGYPNEGALLPVERFMQQYHRKTTALQDAVLRFADGARRGSGFRRLLNRLATRRVEGGFLVDRDSIALDPSTDARKADVLLDLFDEARRRKLAVAHETFERIRGAVPDCEITPAARAKFLKAMSDPSGLGLFVRNLHRIGLLGRFIPAFEHARCLLQWNQYHKYTVDEHSIRALEAALFRLADAGAIGQAYREVHRKDVLHLALLLHDIGKGYEEDHSEVGKRIAEDLSTLLGLEGAERERLVFLVHKHLIMAHVSQRRDLEDEGTILEFVRSVGTVETLKMLYVLTAADTEAVAPGSLTQWKETLLTELYFRSMEALTGSTPVADEAARADAVRAQLRERLRASLDPAWLDARLAALPSSYLRTTALETAAEHLRLLRDFDPKGVRVDARYVPDVALTEYAVFVRDDLVPGIFSRIAGALAAERLEILGAQIFTTADGLVIDTFRVADPDFRAEPPAARRAEVARTVEDVLLGRKSVEALFAARPRQVPKPRVDHPSTGGPAQVAVDNSTSDRHSIVEVFADDRQGLLYEMTHELFELGLSIHSARISTRLDQIVDVFYVTERAGGGKIPDARVEAVRSRVLDVIRPKSPAPA